MHENIERLIEPLIKGYTTTCEKKRPANRSLADFFGLRDFYR